MNSVAEGPILTSYEAALALIPARAFGGRDVARAPGMPVDDFWVRGPSAAGADEVLKEFARRLRVAARPTMLFLLGGPGSGKSFLSERITSDLSEIGARPDTLAYRVYRYQTPGGLDLRLVNDATIDVDHLADGTRAPDTPAPLMRDIDIAIKSGEHLMVNVNRGVIDREIDSTYQDGPSRKIVQWLETGRVPVDQAEDCAWKLMDETPGLFVRTIQLRPVHEGGTTIEVVAVEMDKGSLLEPRPAITASADDPAVWAEGDYGITSLAKRGPELDAKSSAGQLLADFIAQFPRNRAEAVVPVDPITANLDSLQNATIRSGVLSLLRAAELYSASRFTYRELWGAISLITIGQLHGKVLSVSPSVWLERNQPPDNPGSDRLLAMTELASHRFHQALFAAEPFRRSTNRLEAASGLTTGAQLGDFPPVAQLMRQIDPVLDATPGGLNDGGGWAADVLAAFEGMATDTPPLVALSRLPPGSPIHSAITPFDRQLEAVIVEALRDGWLTSAKEARRLRAWYGQYVLRLYAVSHGIPAFRDEVEAWIKVWQFADHAREVPESLHGHFRTLIFPGYQTGPAHPAVSLLPVFDSRTIPLSERAETPTLVCRVPTTWSLTSRAEVDSLFLCLVQENAQVPDIEIELDLPLMREAMACPAGHLGLTDCTVIAAPRLERFRANLLRSGTTRPRYAVVNGDGITDLVFSGAAHG